MFHLIGIQFRGKYTAMAMQMVNGCLLFDSSFMMQKSEIPP